ncbi:unnamed protein product [Phaedon cochleariae]|uniref:LITAF domain-containing protein n=1 Tax=Phaedon cochleariae TaxID=80249 RepID=A0A9N9SJG1_PHACE|nr:unnamed protein product [Phaedon cochleariae]
MDDELGKDGTKEEDRVTVSEATSEIQLEATEPNKTLPITNIPKIHKNDNTAKKNDGQCTVKEILNEILDCQVVRISTNQIPCKNAQTSETNDASADKTSQVASDTLPTNDESAPSKVVTVKQILGEVLNYTVCRQTVPAEFSEPSTSSRAHASSTHRRADFHVFRAGVINSSHLLHSESAKSFGKVLPSYSSVLRMGPAHKLSVSSDSFPVRRPPPSYAEVEGLFEATSPSAGSSESAILGPDPVYVVCPVCRTVVVTDVERERSSATHLLALVLCLFFCWPCCLLPYCMHSCSYSYHSCPNCRHYFGMYRPF